MSSQPHRQALGITAPVAVQHEDDRLAKLKKRIKEKRGPLMVAAMFLACACAAHRSAMHPPGGYWKHDAGGHDAGTPVMANYESFRLLTSMAFFTSLALVVLLSCDRFYRTWEDMIGLLLLALFAASSPPTSSPPARSTASDLVAAGPIDGLLFLLGTVIVLAFLFFGVPRAWKFAKRCCLLG